MTPDHNALLGEAAHGRARRFLYATGFSGHGFLQGPAVGEILRDLVPRAATPFVDVTPLSADRFAARRGRGRSARSSELAQQRASSPDGGSARSGEHGVSKAAVAEHERGQSAVRSRISRTRSIEVCGCRNANRPTVSPSHADGGMKATWSWSSSVGPARVLARRPSRGGGTARSPRSGSRISSRCGAAVDLVGGLAGPA